MRKPLHHRIKQSIFGLVLCAAFGIAQVARATEDDKPINDKGGKPNESNTHVSPVRLNVSE